MPQGQPIDEQNLTFPSENPNTEPMSLTKKYVGSEPMRVNKFMGQAGLCSRREAEALIEKRLVTIDSETISSPGHKILPGQTLTLNAQTAAKLENKFPAVIHKPEGIVSAQPEEGQIPAARLLTRANLIGKGTPPKKTASLPALGRLDMDSRGLLLLSEDGVLAKALIGVKSTSSVMDWSLIIASCVRPRSLALASAACALFSMKVATGKSGACATLLICASTIFTAHGSAPWSWPACVRANGACSAPKNAPPSSKPPLRPLASRPLWVPWQLSACECVAKSRVAR